MAYDHGPSGTFQHECAEVLPFHSCERSALTIVASAAWSPSWSRSRALTKSKVLEGGEERSGLGGTRGEDGREVGVLMGQQRLRRVTNSYEGSRDSLEGLTACLSLLESAVVVFCGARRVARKQH